MNTRAFLFCLPYTVTDGEGEVGGREMSEERLKNGASKNQWMLKCASKSNLRKCNVKKS